MASQQEKQSGVPAKTQEHMIVTGGSKGIGLETVRGLMGTGAHVVIAARDQSACQAACAELRQSSPTETGSCECCPLDLENLASVRAFAASQKKELQRKKQALSVLVNNGGVMGVGNATNAPPGELQDRHMKINHLGGFLLSNLLRECMEPGSRIVNLSSRAHYGGKLKWDEQENLTDHPTWWFPQYCRSKLANTVSTAGMQRKWGKDGIIATSVSPGLVHTNIFTSMPWGLSHMTYPFLRLVGRTPAQGAETVIHAALSPEYKDPQRVPLFLHDCKPLAPLAASHDEKNGKLLWQWSEKMISLPKE